ncbi:MAG: ROK family protein, partial [Micromonosporaceae bacterium]
MMVGVSVVGSYEGVIGVDVGGTRIKAALVDDAGEILARGGCPTPERGDPEAVLAAVAEVVEALRQDERIGGLGVAVPGIIDEPRGVAVLAANLGWRDTPVRDLLAARTGLPVTLGHDVRSACVAEWQVGAGRGCSDLLLVTLGTGIGAGVVADGRLLRGGGYVGQLGHVVVDPDGAACGCGQRGC